MILVLFSSPKGRLIAVCALSGPPASQRGSSFRQFAALCVAFTSDLVLFRSRIHSLGVIESLLQS